MQKLFGTDGIRGLANFGKMTPEVALRVGMAIAHVFCQEGHRGKIIIGKDTRLSGYMFEQALASGICSMGASVYLCGPLPTPGVAFLTASMRADAGVMISASHNPYQDNGIKIFGADGFKLPDALEERIEELVWGQKMDEVRPTFAQIGKAFRITDAIGRYVVFLKNTFPKSLSLEGLKIVIDCANGAAHKVAPLVFQELGATVYSMSNAPNGQNINDGCGAIHPQSMAQMVKQVGASIGIALDGDADRVVFCDEKGDIVSGDYILGLCAKRLSQMGMLKNNTLVTTVMTNYGLDESLAESGIKVIRTPVGDRYVVEKMRLEGYNFGGETSGHLIFLDHVTSGDGIAAALQVLSLIKETKQPLSQLALGIKLYPQILLNQRVKTKVPLESIPNLDLLLDKVRKQIGNQGRVLVRYSGTENEARILLEGANQQTISTLAQEIAQLIDTSCNGSFEK